MTIDDFGISISWMVNPFMCDTTWENPTISAGTLKRINIRWTEVSSLVAYVMAFFVAFWTWYQSTNLNQTARVELMLELVIVCNRLTSICLLLWYYVIIMFTKSLPTTNYPAISPWCHGSCEKRYNKWNCVQPIQFNVVIVVVGHVHTCLGNECSGGGTAVLICRFDSLVACIRSLGSGGRARVRVGMCGDSLDSFWCVRRTCERARKRYLKSGKLPRLFKKMKMSCCCCCCLSHRGEHLA